MDKQYQSLSKIKSSYSHHQHGYHKKLVLQSDEDDPQPYLKLDGNASRKTIGSLSKSKIQNIVQMQEMFKQFRYFKSNLQSQHPIIRIGNKKLQSQSRSTIDAKELSFEDKQKMMVESRKTMFKIVMDNKLRSQSIKDYGFNLRPLFNRVIEKNDSVLEQKRIEIGETPLSNAYYATKALSKKSRMNVYERLAQELPPDSRFRYE